MDPDEFSFFILIAIMSMAICMAIIPVMMHLAPYIGMVDSPDERKVHTVAVPRSGGIGIVIGLLIPLLIWLDTSRFSTSLIVGCLVLLLFGAWDDARSMRPAYKFIGQFFAAIFVVYYGEVYVQYLPFLGAKEIPAYLGQPFTVFAIVGMINALNLSDGLDGLAGGEALVSLIAIVYLSYQFDGVVVLVVAAATIGGIFGFLRFNSHPAKIFMGDSGSQTLGFILAVLVVYLTQQVNSLVSPVVALLLLGLPIVDSVVVFYLRAKRGNSLVTAGKDHLHHRIMALGFYHYESVIIIYSIQIILILSAVLMPYEHDILLFSIYLGLCVLVFSSLGFVEKSNWKAHTGKYSKIELNSVSTSKHKYLKSLPYRALKAALSLFIVAAAVLSSAVPVDIAISSLLLFLLLLMASVLKWFGDNGYRFLMYVTIGFSVYLLSSNSPVWLVELPALIYIFFIMVALLSFVALRITVRDQFQFTPLDYLVVLMVITISVLPDVENGMSSLVWMVVQMIVLFYACELVIQKMRSRINSLTIASLLALSLIIFRGLS